MTRTEHGARTNSARSAILERVRMALARPSAPPMHPHAEPTTGPLFPLPEPNHEAMREWFQRELEAIHGEVLWADSVDAGREILRDWLHRKEITSALAPAGVGLEDILRECSLVEWIGPSDAPENHGLTRGQRWEPIDLGVTPVVALVAESGSVVVSSAVSGRAMSVLPPYHLAIATLDQLVPDLEGAIARIRQKHGDRLPSTLSWITGPSRTADIEKILVLGAHGPRKLTVLLLPAGALATAASPA